jgi:hypothetical protein
MRPLFIKKGSTLQLLIAFENDDGTPLNLTTVVTTSQVREPSGKLIANLVLTTTATAGQYSVAQATDVWPIGQLLMDFKIVQGSVVLKTQTVSIEVVQAITT